MIEASFHTRPLVFVRRARRDSIGCKYLQAGILIDWVRVLGDEGTSQGGSLSPLLANILLDDLDKELERRGHKFCRYADDCNIYMLSERAGERVMKSVTEFLEGKLKLKVNLDKSAVAPSSYSEISRLSDWWQDRTEYSGPEHKAA